MNRESQDSFSLLCLPKMVNINVPILIDRWLDQICLRFLPRRRVPEGDEGGAGPVAGGEDLKSRYTKTLKTFLKWAMSGLFFFIFVFSIQLAVNVQ